MSIGDNWIIECDSKTSKEGDTINGKTTLYFKHVDTEMYLYTDSSSKYTNQNCPRCPIVG